MSKYVVITWPVIQRYMELDGFYENAYLICDDQGMDDYGSSAYFVDEDWLDKVDGTTPQEEKIAMEAINKFIFFCMNYPADFIKKTWKDNPNLASHFENKFNGLYDTYTSNGAVVALYGELADGNKEKLLKYVLENYDGERKLNLK